MPIQPIQLLTVAPVCLTVCDRRPMNDSRTMVVSPTSSKSVRFAVDPPEEEQDQNNWRNGLRSLLCFSKKHEQENRKQQSHGRQWMSHCQSSTSTTGSATACLSPASSLASSSPSFLRPGIRSRGRFFHLNPFSLRTKPSMCYNPQASYHTIVITDDPPRYDWIDIEHTAATILQASYRRHCTMNRLEAQNRTTGAIRNRARRRYALQKQRARAQRQQQQQDDAAANDDDPATYSSSSLWNFDCAGWNDYNLCFFYDESAVLQQQHADYRRDQYHQQHAQWACQQQTARETYWGETTTSTKNSPYNNDTTSIEERYFQTMVDQRMSQVLGRTISL